MSTTFAPAAAQAIDELQPSDTTVLVQVNPRALSLDCLAALRAASEPASRPEGNTFRRWLRDRANAEAARRLHTADDEPLEPEAWLIPWHQWNDRELLGALAASWSLLCVNACEVRGVLDAVHAAVVSVCCCRLGELHAAIQRSQKRGATDAFH